MMIHSMTKPQRNERRNSFPVPNDIFALELLPGELAVYLYLVRCESRKTHQCWPSYRTIGEAVKMSENTVQKYVCSLADKDLIRTENTSVVTRGGLKRNGNLLYTLQSFQNVLEEHHRRKLNELELISERQQATKRLEEYDRRRPRRPLCAAPTTEPESLPTDLSQTEYDDPCGRVCGDEMKSRIKACRLDGVPLATSARSAGSLRGYGVTSFQREKTAFDLMIGLALRAASLSPAPNT